MFLESHVDLILKYEKLLFLSEAVAYFNITINPLTPLLFRHLS